MLRTVEQMVGVAVFLVMEGKVEVVQITAGCFSERIIEQIVNVLVPQSLEEIVLVVSLTNATADRRAFEDAFIPRIVAVTDDFKHVCVGQGSACRLTSRRVDEHSVARACKFCSG